ncbi:16S rRNA (cytosine(1402)-N(4))-methyltransferase RsmH [Candidatus Uhrbacteria bacterium]|nr:16S rRNA (cytosine(1402)-N(4))-methyltransferase RsmH [Candidatus Uhrbacteria bacterium]
MRHVPVLLEEALHWLNLQPGDEVIDCTFGSGGQARAILDRTAPDGRLLGIDLSEKAIEQGKGVCASYEKRCVLAQENFRDLAAIAKARHFEHPKGILMDLGWSTEEIEDPRLGLSFQREGPLDMRFSGKGITAAEIVNGWSESELTQLIRRYGEERYAARVAQAICQVRRQARILSTLALVKVIREALPKNYEAGRIHPATRTFQALRLAVNDELGNLEAGISAAISLLVPQGRLVIISFHSLEDRIVKRRFREESGQRLRLLTKRPVTAGEEETRRNPRARSAKLRAAEKL